jgi:hypothetical protein
MIITIIDEDSDGNESPRHIYILGDLFMKNRNRLTFSKSENSYYASLTVWAPEFVYWDFESLFIAPYHNGKIYKARITRK